MDFNLPKNQLYRRISSFHTNWPFALVPFIFLFASCQKKEVSQAKQIEILNHLEHSRSLILNNHPTAGITYLDSAIDVRDKNSSFYKVNLYQLKRFAEKSTNNQSPRIAEYFDSMLLMDRHYSNDYPKEYAQVLIRRANLYLRQLEFNKAFESLYLARKIAKEHSDNEIVFSLHSIMGNAMFRQNNYKEAALNYSKAYRSAARIPLNQNIQKYQFLNGQAINTGLSFMRLAQYDSAHYYFNKAMESLDSTRKNRPEDHHFLMHGTGVVLTNKANLEQNQNRYKEAVNLYQVSIRYNFDSAHLYSEGLIAVAQLTQLYILQNDLKSAGKMLQTYSEIIDSLAGDYSIKGIEKSKWQYFLAIGDTAKAYNHHLKYQSYVIKDELKGRTFVDIDFEKELNKYKDIWGLKLLTQESQLQQILLGFSMVLILIFLLIFLFVRRTNKKLKRLNNKIQLQNNRLSLSIKSLQRSEDEIKKITRVVAHDLRSPISGFAGLTELLLLKDYFEAEDREFIELIHSTAYETLGFVDELLEFNQDNTKISTEPTDMVLLVEQSILLQKQKANSKEINLELQSEPIRADINREKIGRVLSNIIGNAIKFSHHQSAININLKSAENGFLLSIQDHGIGIPILLQSKLFEAGKEKQRLGTKGEASNGLGMLITKQLVEAHSGTIWFESKEGEGTTFFVKLPNCASE